MRSSARTNQEGHGKLWPTLGGQHWVPWPQESCLLQENPQTPSLRPLSPLPWQYKELSLITVVWELLAVWAVLRGLWGL